MGKGGLFRFYKVSYCPLNIGTRETPKIYLHRSLNIRIGNIASHLHCSQVIDLQQGEALMYSKHFFTSSLFCSSILMPNTFALFP